MNVSGWIPQKPDARDYRLLERMPDLLQAAAPASVPSLTKALPIFDQGNLGSCTAYGSGRAYRYIDRQDGSDFDASELYQYFNSRSLMGPQYVTQDSGATIRDAVKALAQFGLARESDWRYDITRFTQRPPDAAYQFGAEHEATEYVSVPNDIEQMKAVIAAGFPIIVGFTVYQNYQQGIGSGVWPEPQGAAVGGHCVLIDGYEPGWWLFPNSWGTGAGQQGWFRMSWAYLQQNGADFWVVRKVTADTPPAPTPPPAPAPATIPYYVSGIRYDRMSDGATWTSTFKYDPPQV